MTIQKDKDLISKFKDLENQEVKSSNTLKAEMLSIFQAYANTAFTQGQFSKRLDKRTQHINHVLRELMKDNLIERLGSRKQYYYKLKVSK
jgi:predicted HTH transcriptional regulator